MYYFVFDTPTYVIQLNGQKKLITQTCTRLNWPNYWCPIQDKTLETGFDSSISEWGECALSCMENFNETSPILTMAFTPDLMKSLTVWI